MELLIAENTALKARVTELEEITDGYAALAEGYSQELTTTTDALEKTNNALEDAMAPRYTQVCPTPESGTEQLISENTVLKKANQILSDVVDEYDKSLTEMTALQRESTNKLNEATEIIKRLTTDDGQLRRA